MSGSRPDPGAPALADYVPGMGLLRFLWNNNPFYPLSAVMVLAGLKLSYTPDAAAFPTWALLSGLALYAMLLAGMAALLVRHGGVWDDVRTLILLVAMVLLIVPAFFDDLLVRDPRTGVACELAGLGFAVALSEALIRALRLRLPMGYRVPYHLALALFFLHPVALTPLLRRPEDPALMWALFSFPALAGAVALTLLPAARLGPSYVAKNGTPWRWPLYPWSLFVLMSVAVAARAWSVCLAANTSGGSLGYEAPDASIFGPYFLAPFGFAVAILVLEVGIVRQSLAAKLAGLALPAGMVALAGLGHRPDPVYLRFLDEFRGATGGSPMFLALAGAVGFYAVGARRRVPLAFDALTAAVAAMALIGPETIGVGDLAAARAWPLGIAAGLQAARAIAARSSARALLATAGLAAAAMIGPVGSLGDSGRMMASAGVAIGGMLAIGAWYDDRFAKVVRGLAAVALAVAAVAGPSGIVRVEAPGSATLAAVAVAIVYGFAVGGRPFFAAAGAGTIGWLAISGAGAYAALRRSVAGLDEILAGLVLFGMAAAISLTKAGFFSRPRSPRPAEVEEGAIAEASPSP